LSLDLWSKSVTNALKEIYKKNILVMNKNIADVRILLIAPYIGEGIRDYYCGFEHNRFTTNQISCIPQTLEKWE
jgi:hypothetical protein